MGQVINLEEYKQELFNKQMKEAYNEEIINTIERIYDKLDVYPKIFVDPIQCFTKLKVIENFIDMELTRYQQEQLLSQKGDLNDRS